MPARVLVVDDDPTVTEVVARYLQEAGLEVRVSADGWTALDEAARWLPDLVVLDIMLPGIDGFEVLRLLRARTPEVAVVLLTALGEEQERIAGFELGADDYVTKPFSPRELALRVQSVLRRKSSEAGARAPKLSRVQLVDGDLIVDVVARTATRNGAPLRLTLREFDLLAFFLSNADQAFDRQELMAKVWGWTYGDESTVTVHVRRLREKVEDVAAQPSRLVTVWGAGYRWCSATGLGGSAARDAPREQKEPQAEQQSGEQRDG